MKKNILILILVIFSLAVPLTAQFYKVYGYGTPDKNEVELVLWNTFILSSDQFFSYFGEKVSSHHLWAHSLEMEYGLTDHFTVAAYVDFLDPAGKGIKYYRTRAVFFRYRFGEKGKFFFDPALYIEYYFPRPSFKNYEELEVRLILEKDMNHFRLILNPKLEKITSGPKVDEGLEFNYSIGIYWKKRASIQPGLELHGKMGEITHWKSWSRQKHVIFPTLDLRFPPGIHWHLGIGFGLTSSTDNLIIKSIISYEF